MAKEHAIDELYKGFSDSELEEILRTGHEFRKLMSYYKCAMMEVETKFRVLNENMSYEYDRNPIETIKTRLKKPESILEKMKRRDVPFDPKAIEKNIFDIAGVRVICSYPKDVYMLEEYLLRQDDIVLIDRKDYIENPKESGYRSLHLIVSVPIFLADETKMMNVEIQLRTIAMDFWASLEHTVNYKKDYNPSKELLDSLRQSADDISKIDMQMQKIHDQVTED